MCVHHGPGLGLILAPQALTARYDPFGPQQTKTFSCWEICCIFRVKSVDTDEVVT